MKLLLTFGFSASQATARVHFVSPTGRDEGNTEASAMKPLATVAECVSRLSTAGDECRLQTGTYSEPTVVVSGLSGSRAKPVVIAAQEGATVLLDGSAPLDGKWVPGADGLWELALPKGSTEPSQLWLDGEMMTPARWPDASWADRSAWDWTKWATFDGSKEWGPASYKPGQPMTFYDSGKLAKSGIDATGAMMIGNIAHMDTFVGVVTEHKPGSNEFKVVMNVDKMGNTKPDNSIYFLEGLADMVSEPGEWAYDTATRKVTLRTPDGTSPAGKSVRIKDQVYALNITDASHLVLANMSFFGTTVHAKDNIPYLRLESLNFQFPSFSRRMLGEVHTPAPTVLMASDDGNGNPKPDTSSFEVFNCSWYGADGATIQYQGTAGSFVNNLFDSNDFTCHQFDNHRGMGCALIVAAMGSNDVFERNTMRGNGGSVGYFAGREASLRLNRCQHQADISNDGACIQIRSSSATNSLLENNWASESGKGFRLDSGSNSKFVKDEVNNTIRGNVALWSNGFMLKNDYNFYQSNLALWSPNVPLHGSVHDEVFRVDSGRFKSENTHSVVEGNIASSWEKPMHGSTSKDKPNVLDQDVGKQLRDPANYDFRPREGSAVAKAGAGPYDLATTAAGSSACNAGGARYWIPGRQEWKASSPVPPHGSETADANLDLMFLPGLGHTHHAIYLGRSPDNMDRLGQLDSGCNVQDVPKAPLEGTWWWRVDALDKAGDLLATGDAWKFTIGGPSPSPAPTPAPTPSPTPGPESCAACEDQYCSGQEGQGHSCEKCVEANRHEFMDAGCFGSDERHAFLQDWCHGKHEQIQFV